MRAFKQLPLTVAIIGTLSLHTAHANETIPHVTLDALNAQVDRQGTKIKTNIINLKEKDERTETDLRGLLNEEPAINFGGGNGTSQWWTIRGVGQDQIDVKVDNAYSDTQIFHHQGRFVLDPSLVKIVSVQKGAGSASAGIGATSGAIVAKTLEAKELLQNSTNENFGFKVNAGYSSNRGHNYGASIFGKSGQVDALLTGHWTNNDDYKGGSGYTNLQGGNKIKQSALDQRGLLAKIGVDVNDNHRFVASYREEFSKGVRSLREEFDFSQARLTADKLTPAQIAQGLTLSTENIISRGRKVYYVLDRDGNYVSNDVNNSPRQRKIKQRTTTLEWTGQNMGFVDKAEANIYQMDISLKDINNTQFAFDAGVKTTGANINLDSSINNLLLKYGANYRKQEGETADKTTQEKTDMGIYTEVIGYVNDFTLTGGVRYDHFDYKATNRSTAKQGNLNPSMGIIYQFSPSLSFSANHNHATRSPRLRETALGGSENYGIDQNIKAEKARNTEIGFNYYDGNFSANGSYFWQNVDNAFGTYCAVKTGSTCQITNFANLGKIKNKGYELSLGYRMNGLSARIGMAENDPEVYGVADNTQSAILQGRTYTGSLGYKLQNFPVEFGWRGRLVEDSIGTPSRGSSAATATQIRKGYDVHDFYVNWKPYNNDKVNVNFAINNAFNENYRPHAQRAGETTLVGAGRDFRVGVNFTY